MSADIWVRRPDWDWSNCKRWLSCRESLWGVAVDARSVDCFIGFHSIRYGILPFALESGTSQLNNDIRHEIPSHFRHIFEEIWAGMDGGQQFRERIPSSASASQRSTSHTIWDSHSPT